MIEINKFFKKYPAFFKNRNINDLKYAKNFINPDSEDIENPFEFYKMDKAVLKIISYDKKIPIFIHGDCDADGVSAASVLCNYLKKIGYKIIYYIPNRSTEGHTISKKAINSAVGMGCKLMITCDIGMSSFEEIDYAKQKGLSTIVTDHHKPQKKYPDAISIINPWIYENENLSFKDYSGSAVAYKLCHAINLNLELDFKNMNDIMPFAALGIVSDKVKIEGENRYISYHGFNQIRKNKIQNLTALNKKLFPYTNEIDPNKIIRVINMTTKLEDPSLAIKLFTTNVPAQINSIINLIAKKYKTNQITFNNLIQESLRIAYSQNYKSDNCIFIISNFDSAYNGAVASTISKKLNLPAVVISKMKNRQEFKGSARSINGINLFSILSNLKENLITMGGHPMAAGFTIEEKKIKIFKNLFCDLMQNNEVVPKVTFDKTVDGVINFNEIDINFLNFIKYFMPYGSGNPNPIFKTKNIHVIDKPKVIGRNFDTLEFQVENKGLKMNCIGIGLINSFEKLVSKNNLIIDYNIINNNDKITLNVIGVHQDVN